MYHSTLLPEHVGKSVRIRRSVLEAHYWFVIVRITNCDDYGLCEFARCSNDDRITSRFGGQVHRSLRTTSVLRYGIDDKACEF